jgi:hypothetical protein
VNYRGLHNGTEGLIIINAGTLHEPTKNPSSLVPLECPIDPKPLLEDPLADVNIGVAGVQNQVSNVIGHESGILFHHSRRPMRIGEGSQN